MQSRTATKYEKEYLKLSEQVPCLACALFHDTPDTPAEFHHICGKTKIEAHLNGFSLCEKHHRISDTRHPKRWISRHGDGRMIFEARYMPEGAFLLEQQREVARIKNMAVC